MSTFDERLRAAEFAAGVGSHVALAERLGWTVKRLHALIANPERAPFGDMLAVSDDLSVRMRWLVRGTGAVGLEHDSEYAEAALVILGAMPPQKVRFWFGTGRRLAKR